MHSKWKNIIIPYYIYIFWYSNIFKFIHSCVKLLGHSQTWRKHLTLESSKQSHDKMLRISLIFKGLHTQKSKKITFLSRVFKFIQHNTFREIKNWSYYDKFSFLFWNIWTNCRFILMSTIKRSVMMLIVI